MKKKISKLETQATVQSPHNKLIVANSGQILRNSMYQSFLALSNFA